MARLAALAKGNFYPAPLPVLTTILNRIRTPRPDISDGPIPKFYICDPCCGEGEALAHIAAHYSADPRRTFGCELEPTRHAATVARLPACHIVGPANYLSCEVSSHSFSFIWLNPPFDDEIGGGRRVEHDFLRHATRTLVDGGILAFCCPEHVADRWDIKNSFDSSYEDCSITPFPSEHRRFKEVVVIARRRESTLADQKYLRSAEFAYETREVRYEMPKGYYPFTFRKGELTDDEVREAIAHSPLTRLIQSKPQPPLPSPPMSLGKGHVALLLASGHLDGVVYPPDEPPHLVRGTSRKLEYIKSIEDDSNEETGAMKTTVTKSERITLTIRTLSSDGTLATFVDKPKDATREVVPTESEPEDTGESDE
jgi:hypothetical protein